MHYAFLLLCLINGFIFAGHGDLIAENSDPTMNHHVNVISGKLHLDFEDHVVQGAVPLPLRRNYTNTPRVWFTPAKWGFARGWAFFSHTHLYIHKINEKYLAYIYEGYGNLMKYEIEHKQRNLIVMKPITYKNINRKITNYREDIYNNRLYFDCTNDTALLKLANGGKRLYKAVNGYPEWNIFGNSSIGIGHEYTLSEETFPSGQKTEYTHLHKTLSIRNVNPSGNKVFSSLDLTRLKSHPYLHIQGRASDGKTINYHARHQLSQSYLSKVSLSSLQDETFAYRQDCIEPIHWLNKINSPDYGEIKIVYNRLSYLYYPRIGKSVIRKIKHNPQPLTDYKVQSISKKGVQLACFTYDWFCTYVRDVNNILTKYHHCKGSLDKIERFTKDDTLYSTEHYLWKDGNLCGKKFCDASDHILYEQQFTYDAHKNISSETLIHDEKSTSKYYKYNDKHLKIQEQHEDGLTYYFEYLKETNLLTNKKTVHDGQMLFEESYTYDDDLLLIEKKSFDGYRECKESYLRDPETGMITEVDDGLHKNFYTYDTSNRLIKDETAFASLSMEYDAAGKVKSKTFPLRGQNQYVYNSCGNPIELKEVGSPRKYIEYDEFNRPVRCKMSNRTNRTCYDTKGRVIFEKDFKGRTISYVYDEFNRCIKKILPLVQDPCGTFYHPEFLYEYDVLGNLISETSPCGSVTTTTYNIFKKPLKITYADGSICLHSYYNNGDLKETVFEDSEKISFEYDPLHRMIRKKQGPFEERWEYEGALLKKYTNTRGLVTTYEWDEFGRKISEDFEGRKKEFFYDHMGFLYREQEGDIASITIHDVEGRVIETSQNGSNKIRYKYNQEGKKCCAIKTTSQGEAVDQFFYDHMGRLTLHLDPLGEKTEFIYEDYVHTQIDSLGNRSVETFDALSRLILKEQQKPSGETILSESFIYNKAGNLYKRLTKDPKVEVEFYYDCMGRLIKEIEAHKKCTLYSYDHKGRMLTKTCPNGICFNYRYDSFDRMVEMKSSDDTVDYEYIYSGLDLVKITDKNLDRSLIRSYTKFGELAHEIGLNGLKTSWFYDTFGRKKKVILHDNSSILYTYQAGRMISVSRYDKTGRYLYEHQYTAFDPNNHVTEESLPLKAGIQKSTRDLLERAVELSSPFHKLEVQYNPTSLVTKKMDTLNGDKDYSYDALSQLTKEGNTTYDFDPLGNPKEAEINDLNQIISLRNKPFTYDENGNLVTQLRITYSYDALNRLIKTTRGSRFITTFSYDPLSRLISKKSSGTTTHFLYDGNFEIGSIDENNNIQELKILGLGILGDTGAAIALEIKGKTYIPLHDLSGNIIGVVGSDLEVVEKYKTNAFGSGQPGVYISPWRFCSKREIHGLFYFGGRFYSPYLKRWLTPDPLGFKDSRNPYLYVLNSPQNRLDAFGLCSRSLYIGLAPQYSKYQNFVPYKQPEVNNYVWAFSNYTMGMPFIGRANIDGNDMTVFLRSPKNYKYEFSKKELKQGFFNAFSRFGEWIDGADGKTGVFSFQNGIMNSLRDFRKAGLGICDKCPDNTVVTGVYNKSDGFFKDVWHTFLEKWGVETVASKNLKSHFTMLLDEREAHAPKSFIEHIAHSRAGATYSCMFKNMSDKYQPKIEQFVYVDGIGPASLIPQDFGKDTKNYYSTADFVTGWFALNHNKAYYDVTWVNATTPLSERMAGFIDHGLLGSTYQGVTKSIIEDCQDNRGGIHEYHPHR